MTRRRIARWARESALSVGAVVGLLCIIVTLAAVVWDVKPLMFRSGSMSPAIQTGDLAIAHTVDASRLSTGDIVSVVNQSGARVTHRLVASKGSGEVRTLSLQGDANTTPDAEQYVTSRADLVLFRVPKAGYVVNAASSRVGLFVLGLFVAAMLALVFKRSPGGPQGGAPAQGRRRATRTDQKRSDPARSLVLRVAALCAAWVLTCVGSANAAAWTDAVPISGTSLAAYTLPKPHLSAGSCVVTGNSLTGLTATITWPTPASPYSLTHTALLVESNTPLPVTTSGNDKTTKVTSGLLGSLLGQTVTVRLLAGLTSVPSWLSIGAEQKLFVGLLGLSLECATFS